MKDRVEEQSLEKVSLLLKLLFQTLPGWSLSWKLMYTRLFFSFFPKNCRSSVVVIAPPG